METSPNAVRDIVGSPESKQTGLLKKCHWMSLPEGSSPAGLQQLQKLAFAHFTGKAGSPHQP